jgi:hypothetical protein
MNYKPVVINRLLAEKSACMRHHHCQNNQGSVVVLILWVLILITFLTAQHSSHNRNTAGLAAGAWDRTRRDQAVASVIDLFSTGSWPISGAEEEKEKWFQIGCNDLNIWCRVDDEGKRVLINSGSDSMLREKIQAILARNGDENETDYLTDAILDWLDADSLVRTEGAEDKDYMKDGYSYTPSNGPFKVFTEMMLVRGMNATFFWGDPYQSLLYDLENQIDGTVDTRNARKSRSGKLSGETNRKNRLGLEADETVPDFWDVFTVFSKDVKRITLLIPEKSNSYSFVVAFLSSDNRTGTFRILERHQISLTAEDHFEYLETLQNEMSLDRKSAAMYISIPASR